MSVTTRFAPSPTGFLHLGHAYAALFARRHGDVMRLRIEDIDPTRARPEFYEAIEEDLRWLGIEWDGDIRVQSRHFSDYESALARLIELGVVYKCICTRQQILSEIARSGEAPQGDQSSVYPGTCRGLSLNPDDGHFAYRVDVAKALSLTGSVEWTDQRAGLQKVHPNRFGDFIVARKETPTSYNLSVVVDDALQGVTLVTRGEDLIPATGPQRVIQALLGIDQPEYLHHKLIVDRNGQRLAKRDRAVTLRSLRESGLSPTEVLALCQPE